MTREDLFEWVRGEYGVEPERKWRKFPNFAVLRRGERWFAIVMDVPKNKFGLDDDEVVDVINVKADSETIEILVEREGFYRAYHMNKRHWISVFLDGSVDDDRIKALIDRSVELTAQKKKRG